FSPTVTTMRFHPTMVPSPSAIATATLTHRGMNLVALSSDLLYADNFATSSLLRSFSLSFIRKRIASDARYMSLRVLPTAAAGIGASEPYSDTCFEMSWIRADSDG